MKRKMVLVLLFCLSLDFAIGRGITKWFEFAWPPIGTRHPVYHHDLLPSRDVMTVWHELYFYRITTNSLGFRDAEVREISLNSEKQRILLLGDSFLEGKGLNYSKTVASILQTGLENDNIEVLNAGVGSYSPIIYYRKAKALIEKGLKFDKAIVFIDISDIDDALLFEFDSEENVVHTEAANSKFRMTGQKLSWPQKVDAILLRNSLSYKINKSFKRAVREMVYEKALFLLGKASLSDRYIWTYDPGAYERVGKPGLARAQHHMNLLSDLFSDNDIDMMVVVYPWPTQILQGDLHSRQVIFWGDWAKRKGYDFLNLFPLFINEKSPWQVIEDNFFDSDVHWNARGNQLVASEVLKHIEETL